MSILRGIPLLMVPNKMLEAALEYARAGWSVVPIGQGTKYPPIPWAEFQTRRATEDEIRAWWTQWPNANVGAVTGEISGMVVADIDPRHGGSASKQWRLAPTELISDTGGGGHHLFYRHPGTWVDSTVGASAGVDIRADGALVVLPPSIHPSGRPYAWRSKEKPGEWVQTVPPPSSPTDNEERPRWLSEALAGVSSGHRDDTAAQIVGYFVGKGIPSDVVLGILDGWNAKNNPPLVQSDLARIVESVYKGAAKRAVRNGVALNSAPNRANSPFSVTPFRQFMSTYGHREVKWVVPGWFPEDTMLLAVAPPGSYKTWMLFDLAVSIATGKPFLGHYPVEKTGPVIIVQQEDYLGDVATRLSEILWHKMDYDNSNWFADVKNNTGDTFTVMVPPPIQVFLHEDRRLHFEDVTSMQSLYSLVENMRPVLVMIDPLYSAASTDDFMAKAAGSMLMLKTMRDKFRTSFAIAHHTKKSTGEGKANREDAWGSQFLNAFLETGWQIRRVEDQANTVVVQPHFKVKGEVPAVTLRFDVATEDAHRYAVTLVDENSQDKPGVSILGCVEEGPCTTKDIVAKTGWSDTKVKEALTRMKDDGVINQQGRLWKIGAELPPL